MRNTYYVVTYNAPAVSNAVFFNKPDAEEFVSTGLWWAKNNNAVIEERICPEDSELTSVEQNEAVVTVYNSDNDKSDVYTISIDKDGYLASLCNVQTLDEELVVIHEWEMSTPQWIWDIYEPKITDRLSE